MDLTGIWKPFGKYVTDSQKIIIQGNQISYWRFIGKQGMPQENAEFYLEPEKTDLKESNCYNLLLKGDEYRNYDAIIHEENLLGKNVFILSEMTMEYDGRGRIVRTSYIREDDYSRIDPQFESKAYQYFNNRIATPMQATGSGTFMNMGMGMMSLNSAPPLFTAPPSGTPWSCTCAPRITPPGFARSAAPQCP